MIASFFFLKKKYIGYRMSNDSVVKKIYTRKILDFFFKKKKSVDILIFCSGFIFSVYFCLEVVLNALF